MSRTRTGVTCRMSSRPAPLSDYASLGAILFALPGIFMEDRLVCLAGAVVGSVLGLAWGWATRMERCP